MDVVAGFGRGGYLLLFPAMIACRRREHRHCVGDTRLEVAVPTDSFLILNGVGRRKGESLSRRYE